MITSRLVKKEEIDFGCADICVETRMVCSIRLMLAVAVLLTITAERPGHASLSDNSWLPLVGYVIYSAGLCVSSMLKARFTEARLFHWLDLGWYASMLLFSEASSSAFFLFFFFPIFSASFHWGFEEGSRIAIASAGLFMACSVLAPGGADLPQLLMRMSFLLAFGYLSAQWGESKVASARRLALLREVNRLSNPRFGVDHTITNILVRIRDFFDGSSCILVTHDSDSKEFTMRKVCSGKTKPPLTSEKITADAAAPLREFSPAQIIVFAKPSLVAISLFGRADLYDCTTGGWQSCARQFSHQLANLLETRSFASVPILLKNGEGRIYVTSSRHAFSKADALFLKHVVAQAFPVIENIELLDRIASHAALRERQRIAWDFHDTAIQPYIGLKMGLSALRNKAAADNPLIADLDKLLAMAAQVIGELRQYAGMVKSGAGVSEPVYLLALRRQAAQTREFYGVDIAIHAGEEVAIGDRVAAEVLQIAREGISNICKHTTARRGAITIRAANGWLSIQIENEEAGLPPRFMPRSIMERTAALGGNVIVKQQAGADTCVHVEIPI